MSTRTPKKPRESYERLKHLEENASTRRLGRKGFGYNFGENKETFLTCVFDDLFAHDSTRGFGYSFYIGVDSEGGEDSQIKNPRENPCKDMTHVYYDNHYYIELIPSEWEYSEEGEVFFSQQLENVKVIKPSYTKSLVDEIDDLIEKWRSQGFITMGINGQYHQPGYCRYCGKKIDINPGDIPTRGRTREYCCDEHKARHRNFERYFEKLRSKGELTETMITIHDVWGIPSLENERLLRPRCQYCGGVIPDGKPFGTRFCEGKCKKFDTCHLTGVDENGNMLFLKHETNYCVYECQEREVTPNKCKDAFKYRLAKEREKNENITDKDLIEILIHERKTARIREENYKLLLFYIEGGANLNDTTPGSPIVHLRNYFGSEFDDVVREIKRINSKMKERK